MSTSTKVSEAVAAAADAWLDEVSSHVAELCRECARTRSYPAYPDLPRMPDWKAVIEDAKRGGAPGGALDGEVCQRMAKLLMRPPLSIVERARGVRPKPTMSVRKASRRVADELKVSPESVRAIWKRWERLTSRRRIKVE